MHKRVIGTLLAIFLVLPGVAAAQIEIGLKGGVSFANIPELASGIEDEGATTENRIGAAGGAHFLLTIGGIVGLQGEVLYTQKGIKAKGPSGIDEAFEMKVDYIDVPILLRLGVTGGRGLQFLVGPSFNFNTSAKFELSGEFAEEEDIKGEIEDFEVGLVLGVGYYGRRVLVEGRYQEGLTDIIDATDFFDDAAQYKNRTFLVLFGVQVGG
jgi:hypothetical protein